MLLLSEAKGIVVQHNDIINARFDMTSNELKLFLAMLTRVKKDTDIHQEFHIPVAEVLSGDGGSVYSRIVKAGKGLVRKVIEIETQYKGKKKWVGKPLMAKCEYTEGSGVVIARFNVEMESYLVQISKDFTTAELTQLLKLRTFAAYRLYWLLKQYVKLGRQRTIGVAELRQLLCLEEQYPLYANFKQRILNPAQEELRATDLNFEFTEIKHGKAVEKIKFTLANRVDAEPVAITADEDWVTKLQEIGVSSGSITGVRALLGEERFPVAYISYCLNYYRKVERTGGIKRSLGDAVFSAIITQNLMERYKKEVAKQKPKPTPVSPAQLAWNHALSVIAPTVSSEDYQTWFAHLVPVSYAQNELVLSVPSPDYVEMLETSFLAPLCQGVRSLGANTILSYEYHV